MRQDFSKDVTITSRGQLTLPTAIRKALKLGSKRKVRVAMTKAGTVTLRTLPDVASFFGILKNGTPYDQNEKEAAREAMGRRRPAKEIDVRGSGIST